MTDSKIFIHHTGHMWGIGCFAQNKKACQKLAEIKNRSEAKGFIVLTHDKNKIIDNCENENIKHILRQYWPGNLTVAIKNFDPSLKHLEFNGTIAFRVPESKTLLEFLKKHKKTIVSTSVNYSGKPYLTNLEVIKNKFDGKFDFIANTEEFTDLNPSTLIKANQNDIELIRQGSIDFDEIWLSFKKPLITFTCTGNTCRSPLAEFYAKYQIENQDLNFRVASAGELDCKLPIAEHSKKILNALGIDCSSHYAKQITADIIRKSYLIVTMTKNHKSKIIENYPLAFDKVVTLAELTNLKHDIADPYQKSYEDYLVAFAQIKKGVDALLKMEL